MSKVIPIALQAHYDSRYASTALIWRLTRLDGQVFGFTDHDRAIPYEGVSYEPNSAFDASAIQSRDGLNVNNLEAQGLLDSAGITVEDIEAGRWDGALVLVRKVNWSSLGDGAEIMLTGELGTVQRKTGQYIAEVRGLMAKLQNNIGRSVYPNCDAVLGDARCGVVLDGSPSLLVEGTVFSVASIAGVVVSGAAQATGYFSGGVLVFTSGLNSGLRFDIKTHTLVSGKAEIVFHLPLPYPATPADAVVLTPGCDKSKVTCITKFNNVLNFRGFSFVPGNDSILQVGGQ